MFYFSEQKYNQMKGGKMKKTLIILGILMIASGAFAATRTVLGEDFGYVG